MDEALEMAEEARGETEERGSFAAGLFMGRVDSSQLFPFPQQDPEDARIGDLYLAELTQYLKENLDPDEVERSREIPKEVVKKLAEMGAFALKIPKQYGGMGLSQTNYNRIAERVASYCGSTAVLLSAHQSIGVPQPLKLYGTEEQKARFLPRFREGKISAFALTEQHVGSDPARIATTAELTSDGSHYRLNGTKLWCTNGTIADIIIVIAKTAPKVIEGKEKIQLSMFIVEMDSPGVEVVQRCEFMGLGALYNGAIQFKNVKIPVENRIGEEGRGLAMALATINVGRLTLPAASVGVAKQCLSIARRWGKERVQWGESVGLHEEGRKKLAEIAATTFAMEAVATLTSRWQDHHTDIRIEAAMAKLFSSEALWQIADQTLQLRGGRGYEKASSLKARGEIGYPIERILRDCRVNRILEGSTEIMHLFLAREALDPHLKQLKKLLKGKLRGWAKAKEILRLLFHYSSWLTGLFFSGSTTFRGPLKRHMRFVHRAARKMARRLVFAMVYHQKGLEKRQLLLGRLVEIGTELFVMAATCSFALSQKQEGAVELADFFCKGAQRRIKGYFAALSDNDDRQLGKLGKRVVEREFGWLEEGIIWIGPNA